MIGLWQCGNNHSSSALLTYNSLIGYLSTILTVGKNLKAVVKVLLSPKAV